MAFEVSYDSVLNVVVLACSGETGNQEILEGTRVAVDLANRHGVRCFLMDAREVELNATHGDIFQYPKLYRELGLDASAKVALVRARKEKTRALGNFYETVCLNRGFNVRLFEHFDAAASWLSLDSCCLEALPA